MPTIPRRLAAVAAALLGTVLLAGPAMAHVEVDPAKAEAGASNVVLNFRAEAESPSAGVRELRVVLPAGIAPGDVELLSGPAGWRLTPTADGYGLAGPALPVHKDVTWALTVRKLPDGPTAVFKTLVTYTDGKVDRWIEVPPAGGPEPDNPATVLTLTKPKGAPATTQATTPPTTEAPAATQPAAAREGGGSGAGAAPAIGLVVALAAAVVIGLGLARRARGRA